MDARRGLIDEFAIAAGVLTRFPLAVGGGRARRDRRFRLGFSAGRRRHRRAVRGCLFCRRAARLPVGAAALLAVAAGIAATGALHEDGLADTADGFGGGRDRERKLAIMRDSAHGTYGIVALVLSIGLRATAIAAIRDPVFVGLALDRRPCRVARALCRR